MVSLQAIYGDRRFAIPARGLSSLSFDLADASQICRTKAGYPSGTTSCRPPFKLPFGALFSRTSP